MFCGLNKSIPQGVMTKLDKDIKEAKARGNKALKKHLKRKYERLGMLETRLLTLS